MSSRFQMDKSCFACGKNNDNGLKLEIAELDDGVQAMIDLPKWTQGYNRVVHGGIIATILDELAVWAAFKKGHKAVTGELSMRIKKAMCVETTYTASAKIVKAKHRLLEAESKIVDDDHELVASAMVRLLTIV